MLPRLPPQTARSVVAPIVIAGVLSSMSPASVVAGPAEGQAPAPTATTAIRSISVAADGPALVVTIEATGPLPLPTAGTADGPPRIYFDFPGVALKERGLTASTDPRIRRIRAEIHSATPLVTRVVLDLVGLQPYRLEQAGERLRVILGESAAQLSPRITPVAPTDGPAVSLAHQPAPELLVAVPREPALSGTQAPAPARPSAPADAPAPPSSSGQLLPAKDLERYRPRVSPVLDRLRRLRPLLTSLDGAEDQTVERVQLAVEELERLRQEFAGIKPPETLRSQHDMLLQATTLALMATRLRIEAFRTSDQATLRNARSAAAGATLLLARVCADLGCPDSGR